MGKFIFSCFAVMMLVACANRSDAPVDLWSDTVLAIPEWEMTPEEKAMKEAFDDILYDKVEIVGKKLVLTVDKEYFLEKGLPEEYYDKFVQGLEISEKTRRKQNRELKRWAEEGLMNKDEADIYLQFKKAQEEYRSIKKP